MNLTGDIVTSLLFQEMQAQHQTERMKEPNAENNNCRIVFLLSLYKIYSIDLFVYV